METRSIAYQGEPGANSHIACVENFPDFTPVPCPTFEDAFAALQDGSADLGMIPIENSIAGRVADIHALLPASGLHIVGEKGVDVGHPAGDRVVDRDHAEIGRAVLQRGEGVLEGRARDRREVRIVFDAGDV